MQTASELSLTDLHYIFAQRRQFTGIFEYKDLKATFQALYHAQPTPFVDAVVQRGWLSVERVMNLLYTHFYFSHELVILDRTLNYRGDLGAYRGEYQFYLISALAGRFAPNLSREEVMRRELIEANVYGWFSSAWGGMYLDFGFSGAIFMILVCGILSGRVYRRAIRRKNLGAQLILCYVFAGIIARPILSMFTISISLPILVSILVTSYFFRRSSVTRFLRPVHLRPARWMVDTVTANTDGSSRR